MPASLDLFLEMVADIFDSHTAALFLTSHRGDFLDLAAHHTLSASVETRCRIPFGHGLIGWVAREQKSLHVTRFDRDTRTLGMYAQDVEIKALLAVPLPLGKGVLMVDSRNRYAFPAKKQRVLEDCARVVWELWSAEQRGRELDFFHRWSGWYASLSADFGRTLHGLSDLFGLREGLVVFRRAGDGKSVTVKAASGGFPQPAPGGAASTGGRGFVDWIFRHGRHLLLTRLRDVTGRSYILHPDEPYPKGPVLLGLFQPLSEGALAWVLTGDADVSGWPRGVAEMTVQALDGVFSAEVGSAA